MICRSLLQKPETFRGLVDLGSTQECELTMMITAQPPPEDGFQYLFAWHGQRRYMVCELVCQTETAFVSWTIV
jgi:hypothetical protein